MNPCDTQRGGRNSWPLWKGLVWLALLGLIAGLTACAGPARSVPVGRATEPLPVKTKRPTFTPTSEVPPTPTVPPTATPLPITPTPTVAPTDTPVPATFTPTPEPSPVVEVAVETLNVRAGPGTAYGRVGQVHEGDRLDVLAQSPAGEWYQVCCVEGEEGWVASEYVRLVQGTTGSIALATAIPPTPRPRATDTPAPPPTATVLPTPTTPPYSFVAGEVTGYVYDKPYLTIKGKIWDAKAQKALQGYRLKVFRNGVDVGVGEVSRPGFGDATCPDCGDNRKVNVKFEYNPAGDAEWEVYVVDGNGNRVSESLTLTTSTASPKWYYVDFHLR